MQVVVMAGGAGSRLGALTAHLPKPLLPMGEGTMLGQLLDRLVRHGATEFVVCIGPRGRLPLFLTAIGHSWRGTPVRYVPEDTPLGTAGCLALVEGLAPDFVIVNCDIVTDLDFSALMQSHLAAGAAATVATGTWTERLRFGTVKCGSNDRICQLEEKPTIQQEILLGAYALARAPLMSHLPFPAAPLDMPDLLTAMIRAGQIVRRLHSEASWQDVGTPLDYERACQGDVCM